MPIVVLLRVGSYTLTQADVDKLNDIGITHMRYISGAAATYDNSQLSTEAPVSIPNRVFDEIPAGGAGISVQLTAGMNVAAIMSGSTVAASFAGNATGGAGDSSTLAELFGVDGTIDHVAIVMGVGNNSTLVTGFGGRTDARFRSASLAQAPYYNKVKPEEYGRFLAVFLMASDVGSDGITEDDYYDTPRFLGVLDARGGMQDEENAEWRGTQD